MSDATTFNLEEGLSWLDPAGRTRTENDLAEWIAKRASAGAHGATRLPTGQQIHKLKIQNARAKHFMFEHAFLNLRAPLKAHTI